jgi:hypothetical protein
VPGTAISWIIGGSLGELDELVQLDKFDIRVLAERLDDPLFGARRHIDLLNTELLKAPHIAPGDSVENLAAAVLGEDLRQPRLGETGADLEQHTPFAPMRAPPAQPQR